MCLTIAITSFAESLVTQHGTQVNKKFSLRYQDLAFSPIPLARILCFSKLLSAIFHAIGLLKMQFCGSIHT